MNIGERIKERRRELKMTQDELAERCGYKSKVSISRIEKNKQVVPLDKLGVLAKALYTTTSYLAGYDEIDNEPPSDEGKYLEMLHKDPAYKVLLDSTSKLNSESLKKLISFIETLE